MAFFKYFSTVAVSAIVLTACNQAATSTPNTQEDVVSTVSNFTADSLTVPVIASDRSEIGTATLSEGVSGVILRLQVSGLPEGWHGMHFHVKADCADDAFKNSGGHINPSGKQHGLQNPQGPDNADMPNIYANAAGAVNAEVFTDRVSLTGRGGRPALLDEDGSALVIHANPDDQITQPIGGAGGRIACAAITR